MQENVELFGMERLHFRHSAGLSEGKPWQSLLKTTKREIASSLRSSQWHRRV